MENLSVLNSKERKGLYSMMETQYGCTFGEDYEIYMNSANKIFIINKDIARINLSALRINSFGLYAGEIYNGYLRLSFDGAILLGKKATKGILDLTDDLAERWSKGEDVVVDSDLHGYMIVRSGGDILGCGKLANKKLYNYVPKERRFNNT
ncbi:MAG: hypothetical protein HGA85_06245 [Nanoarchaeota archaeon]|nr:hypothetical protein [Nanoarchaeota archaeon]